jgi:hypothetical protein
MDGDDGLSDWNGVLPVGVRQRPRSKSRTVLKHLRSCPNP